MMGCSSKKSNIAKETNSSQVAADFAVNVTLLLTTSGGFRGVDEWNSDKISTGQSRKLTDGLWINNSVVPYLLC